MKTLAILAALTVIAAPAFAAEHMAKTEHKMEKKMEVSSTMVSGTAVSDTMAKPMMEKSTEVKTEKTAK